MNEEKKLMNKEANNKDIRIHKTKLIFTVNLLRI